VFLPCWQAALASVRGTTPTAFVSTIDELGYRADRVEADPMWAVNPRSVEGLVCSLRWHEKRTGRNAAADDNSSGSAQVGARGGEINTSLNSSPLSQARVFPLFSDIWFFAIFSQPPPI
jgi:hypothetical protein